MNRDAVLFRATRVAIGSILAVIATACTSAPGRSSGSVASAAPSVTPVSIPSPPSFSSPSPSVSYTEVHIRDRRVEVPLDVPVTDAVRFEVNDYDPDHPISVRSPSGKTFHPDPTSGVVYNQQVVFVTDPEPGVWTLTMVPSSHPWLVRVAAIPVNIPVPPVAVMNVSVEGSLTVRFDASGSHDPDGTVVGVEWSFGDGAYGVETSGTHTYAAPGTYLVTLDVVDNEGGRGFASSYETVK